jgi:hypothetical protein
VRKGKKVVVAVGGNADLFDDVCGHSILLLGCAMTRIGML